MKLVKTIEELGEREREREGGDEQLMNKRKTINLIKTVKIHSHTPSDMEVEKTFSLF